MDFIISGILLFILGYPILAMKALMSRMIHKQTQKIISDIRQFLTTY